MNDQENDPTEQEVRAALENWYGYRHGDKAVTDEQRMHFVLGYLLRRRAEKEAAELAAAGAVIDAMGALQRSLRGKKRPSHGDTK